MIFIFVLVAVLIIVAICVLIMYLQKRCPNCKKAWALQFHNKTERDQKSCSKRVEKKIKDKQGNVIGSTFETVYGTRYYYDVVYKCKCCGKEVKRIKIEDRY